MEIVNIEELNKSGYYVGIIDGKSCKDVNTFLIEIGKAFKFPDYYGVNFAAFGECINDLDWIEEYSNYVLIIKNSADFLLQEPIENVKQYLLQMLLKTIHEWANVPNFAGEEEFRKKAEFKIVFEQSKNN